MKRSSILRRKPMQHKRPETTSGIRPEQRLDVAVRDRGRCLRCGRSIVDYPASIHHRLLRSRGGGDALSNLTTLCGTGTTGCHGQVHHDVAQATDDGWICRTGENPADVPVFVFHLGERWLTDDGRVLTHTEHQAESGAA